MIDFVRCKLVIKAPPHLTVDVGGVGYDIEAPMSTFYTLPALGSEVRLLTLVQRQCARRVDQRAGRYGEGGVIGEREYPGLANLCHGEGGRRLPRGIEEADRIAVAKSVGAHGGIIVRNGFARRTREAVTLGILQHDAHPPSAGL